MAQDNTLAQKVPLYKNKQFWLVVIVAAFLAIWFMPPLEGLTRPGQHALAVVILTIGLWLSKAVPPGVGSLIMLGIVSVFMRNELPAAKLFNYWTQETIWFIITCFVFATVMKKSGLGHRLSTIVFSIKSPLLLNIAIAVVNLVFSILGMAVSLPKLTLLFPILVSIATLSGLDKQSNHVRRLAIMINLMANTTGALVYTGFSMNPAMAPLGGFEMNYTTWLLNVTFPAFVGNIVLFLVIYFMYRPRKGEGGFDFGQISEMRKELGPMKPVEWHAVFWFAVALLFWATAGKTGIGAGFATVLVVGAMCLPKVGIINFKEFLDSIQWPTVFMLMGVLAFGALGATGFTKWLVARLMPSTLPASPMISLLLICFLVEILHIPLGSIATSMALLIPVLIGVGPSIGVSPVCITIVTYMCILFQAFFPYQNVAFVAGLSYGLWEEKDLVKTGIVLFFLVPIVFSIILYPYYVYMGWIL